MREVNAELKALRLYGMAAAWSELNEGDPGIQAARWLIERLLEAEATDRAMRSVRYQMHSARFPVHRDLAGFQFEHSCVDRKLIFELADLGFTEAAPTIAGLDGCLALEVQG